MCNSAKNVKAFELLPWKYCWEAFSFVFLRTHLKFTSNNSLNCYIVYDEYDPSRIEQFRSEHILIIYITDLNTYLEFSQSEHWVFSSCS